MRVLSFILSAKSFVQASSVPDVKATLSPTLEDEHRVCHTAMHKSPVQWTGLFILAGATGIEGCTFPSYTRDALTSCWM